MRRIKYRLTRHRCHVGDEGAVYADDPYEDVEALIRG
jgi:hypothetical protein